MSVFSTRVHGHGDQPHPCIVVCTGEDDHVFVRDADGLHLVADDE